MRIAMIGSRGLIHPYSGIETALQALCPRLVQRGHQVTVYGDRHNAGAIDGVQLESVPAFETKHLETLSRSLVATLRATSRGFDVVHYHDVGPALFGALARLRRVPAVLTLHSLDWQRAKWSRTSQAAIRAIEQLAIPRMNRVAVVSRSLGTYLKAEYGLDSEWLPNVVEPARAAPPTSFSRELGLEPRKYVLYAGRLVREKALHDLIRAFRALTTDFKLVIAGEDRHDDGYCNELKLLARGSATLFTGHVPRERLQELYANAYVFVLPSYVEGRSMALLEALAHRSLVLVSDIAENRELVSHERAVFKTGDVADLTEKLGRLLSNRGEAERLRTELAAATDGSLTWEDVVSGYERLYREARS
jgi:glycosyltransferase involved in cell wall biosynthesis